MTDKQITLLLILIPLILSGMFLFDRISAKKHPSVPIVRTVLPTTDTTTKENTIYIYDTIYQLLSRDNLVSKLSSIYTAEIGVRELTGKNDGERVEEYLASCGLEKGYAWCAAFINWCLLQVGIKGAGSYSPNWFPKDKTIYTRGNKNNQTPSQCDIFGIYFAEKNRIAHVGFIDQWTEGSDYCITVEGNTNDTGAREGDGVYKKRRLKNQIYKVSRWI